MCCAAAGGLHAPRLANPTRITSDITKSSSPARGLSLSHQSKWLGIPSIVTPMNHQSPMTSHDHEQLDTGLSVGARCSGSKVNNSNFSTTYESCPTVDSAEMRHPFHEPSLDRPRPLPPHSLQEWHAESDQGSTQMALQAKREFRLRSDL